MTVYDYSGWIILSDGTDTYKIRCGKQPGLGLADPSAVHIDYPSDGHTGWTLDTRKREVKMMGIWFTTTARYDAFMAFLEAGQNTGLTLQIQISTTPTYQDWDGSNHTTMPVMWNKPRGIKKLFGGNTEIWEIGQIVFRQKGALTA